MSLPPEVEASYVKIIDSILAASDLNTITSKRIREGLQAAVEYDITPQKNAIKTLIMARFDKFVAEKDKAPVTNGHSATNGHPPKEKPPPSITMPESSPPAPLAKTDKKRHSEDDDLSDVPESPQPKKKRIKTEAAVDDDAAYAARLQAELNAQSRPTRGGVNKKASVVKKKKTPKKKTPRKIKGGDDSDLAGSGSEEKNVNRSGGFHKPLVLSAPLSALLNETQLSRPQVVKRIWAYVRERDLQDPKDKRQIRCDESMRAVFKQDKVHMFTMNKILNQNLYSPDE
ncbi:MAG: hypothetical protein MMC33_006503 [Icmadophila ericetorum]|nr:hypothetical protein [Icmadophila ericetorum]